MQKYIFVNNVMMLNPDYVEDQKQQGIAPSNLSPHALTVLTSPTEVMQASNAKLQATNGQQAIQTATATQASVQVMQSDRYLNQFHAPQKVSGGTLLDKLTRIFARYEIPIGLINKLLMLAENKLNFILDNSGSMLSETAFKVSQCTDYVKRRYQGQSLESNISRWHEAEDRIHIMLDMLAYIPTGPLTFSCLNGTYKLELNRNGMTPDQFKDYAHNEVSKFFNMDPYDYTPACTKLKEVFSQSTGYTRHYFLTDGEPSDGTPEQLGSLVINRPVPKDNPFTFVSCTNKDAEWMKRIESIAQFCAEVDDFDAESNEVLEEQGEGFPYTRGFYLICLLVAASNPHDLDKMDESTPFTLDTMNNLLGYKLSPQEYRKYWDLNPYHGFYEHLFHQFNQENVVAYQIPGVKEIEDQLKEKKKTGWKPTPIKPSSIQPIAPSMYQNNQQSYNPNYQQQSYPNNQSTQPPYNPNYQPNNASGYPGNPGNPPQNYQPPYNPNYQPNQNFYSQQNNPGMWNNAQPTQPNNPTNNNQQGYNPPRRNY